MREAMYGVFNQIGDARSALGQVKKASWNRTRISVIYPEMVETGSKENSRLEMAAEGFIEDNQPKAREEWPGLKTGYLDGVGSVKYGSMTGETDLMSTVRNGENGLQQALSAGKVVAIVEVDPEAAREVRLIFDSCGGTVVSNQANA